MEQTASEKPHYNCQLENIRELCHQSSMAENCHYALFRILQEVHKKEILLKKALKPLKDKLLSKESSTPSAEAVITVGNLDFTPGDFVRVRSKEDIKKILKQRQAKCPFMPEMFDYCDGEYMVKKRVNYFFDENLRTLRKARDAYILEGSFCKGNRKLYVTKCDLNCFFFWHRDWLEKI